MDDHTRRDEFYWGMRRDYRDFSRGRQDISSAGGFTLIEMLAVVSIISVLMGIMLPVVGRVRRAVYATKCGANMRSLWMAEWMTAQDHRGLLPPSAAMLWSPAQGYAWLDPSMVVSWGFDNVPHRNQSEYIGERLESCEPLHCPESPGGTQVLKQAWDEGDDWKRGHSLTWTKCFWRNWKGKSADGKDIKGPRTTYERGAGRVQISDMINYGYRKPETLMSSAPFKGSHSDNRTTSEVNLWPDLWTGHVERENLTTVMATIGFRAVCVDGSVMTVKGSDTMGVWVRAQPFRVDDPGSKGMYYLPIGGLR